MNLRRHKHNWRPDRWGFRRFLGGTTHTFVVVQCEGIDCAKVKEFTLGRVRMTDNQISNAIFAKFGVVVTKTAEGWVYA